MKILILLLFSVIVVDNRWVRKGYHAIVGVPKAKWLMDCERKWITSRIVGGSQVTTESAYPFQAGIVVTLTTGWPSVCGGALISNTRVLTAAHCWWDGENQASNFEVVLGSLTLFTGGTRIPTRNVTPHPSWNVESVTFDIAIVRISTVQYTNKIQAISLPTLADVQTNFVGHTGIATGYGKTQDSQSSISTTTVLHQTSLDIISNSECQKSFEMAIHGSHLCTKGAKGVGTCDGDSGGPLVVFSNNQRILVGLVSFGLGDGCELGLPSVFTRVTGYITWIQANL